MRFLDKRNLKVSLAVKKSLVVQSLQVIDISYLIWNGNSKELTPVVFALNSEKLIDNVMYINIYLIIKWMTFVYLTVFTSELKILHLPSLLLPVLFHLTFTYFIYRKSAGRDRDHISFSTASWLGVARNIAAVLTRRKS